MFKLTPPLSFDEAEYTIDLAHTERDICETLKRTAELQAKAHDLRAQLHRMQVQRATSNLADAELRVGRVSLDIQRRHLKQYPSVGVAIKKFRTRGESYF